MPTAADIGPMLAKWLAPYIAEELKTLGANAGRAPNNAYDAATCELFVRELGMGVLNRAADFFMKLDTQGRVGSVELAQHLNIGTPRNIPSNLTNSLKQRAKSLGLERPWREDVSADNRTVWVDRDGIASRMVDAIRAEHHRRLGP